MKAMEEVKMNNGLFQKATNYLKDIFKFASWELEGIPCCMLAFSVFFCFQYASQSVHNTDGRLWGTNAFNYIIYIGTIVVAVCVYLITIFFLKKINRDNSRFVRFSSIIYLLFLLLSFLFLWNVYKNEINEYAGSELYDYGIRENVQHWVFAIIMGILIIGSIYVLKNVHLQRRYMRWIFLLSVAIVAAILTYAPNTFLNSHWGLAHTHAYENSIINIARFQPYTEVNRSVYGHYALVYLPFVKLFGNNMIGVAGAIAFFSLITYVCSFYIVDVLIKNDGAFIAIVLAIASIGTLTYGGGQYLQVLPHRLVVEMSVLAYLTYRTKASQHFSKKKSVMFDIGISVFAFIMGIEGGVITITLLLIYRCLVGEKNVKGYITNVFQSTLIGIASFYISFAIINLYNLIVGGAVIGLRTFIYPILSEEFLIFNLRTPLPNGCSGAVLRVVVFTIFMIRSLITVLMGRKEEDLSRMMICLIVSLSGMAWFLYYINRTAVGNMAVSYIPFVLLLGTRMEDLFVQSQGIYNHKNLLFRRDLYGISISILCTFIVMWCGIEGGMSLGDRIQNRASTVWNMNVLNESIDQFQKEIPKDTMAFGTGMPELYYQMGWDPQVVLFDWIDPQGTVDSNQIRKIFSEADSFVAMSDIAIPENFVEVKQIETPCFTAGYYVRNE